jgi:hypothetical protein
VLTLLAQNLAKSKNVEHLAALRGALPVQTAAGDKILSYELSVRLSEVHKVIFLNLSISVLNNCHQVRFSSYLPNSHFFSSSSILFHI